MKIKFSGAIEDVTGSMSVVYGTDSTLLIDCGMAQGLPEVEVLNRKPFPIDPRELSAIILTHAHLDHCGRLPQIVKQGFKGKIFASQVTIELARIILQDAAEIEDESPLYDSKDVQETLNRMHILPELKKTEIHGFEVTLRPSGHILGANSILLEQNGKSVVFSGDLGRSDDPLLPAPLQCPKADLVVMESTYGGKNRIGNMDEELSAVLRETRKNSSILLIASFAVARGQNLLTLLHDHFRRFPEERIPLFIDSPMMEKVNRIYRRFSELTTDADDLRFAINEVESILSVKHWDSIKHKKGPLIILASSGMLTGGRIWRHLENWKDSENTILFLPGYQAEGTQGQKIIKHQEVRSPKGTTFKWSGKVVHSSAFSSHADSNELINWIHNIEKESKIALIHGESDAKLDLEKRLKTQEFKNIFIPTPGFEIII